jgi:hypothetical protein
MTPNLRALALAALVALLAAPAAAGFIPYEPGRGVRSVTVVDGIAVFDEASSMTTGAFDGSVVTVGEWWATQSSTIGTGMISGTGSAGTGLGAAGGESASGLVTRLSLSEPTKVTLEGTLTNESTSGYLNVTFFQGLFPLVPPNILYMADASLEHTIVPLFYEAVLPAGDYLLYVEASFNGSLTGVPPGESATWEITVHAPEPGTAALLGLGLAGLAALRPRR